MSKSTRPTFCPNKAARKSRRAALCALKTKEKRRKEIKEPSRPVISSTPIKILAEKISNIEDLKKEEEKNMLNDLDEENQIEESIRSILEKVNRRELEDDDTDDFTDDETIVAEFKTHRKCNVRCRVKYIKREKTKAEIMNPMNKEDLQDSLRYIQRNPDNFTIAEVKVLKGIFLEWNRQDEDDNGDDFEVYKDFIDARSAIRGYSDTEEDSDDDTEEDSNEEDLLEQNSEDPGDDNEEDGDSKEDKEKVEINEDSETFIDFGETSADFYLSKYKKFANECKQCGKFVLYEDAVVEEDDQDMFCDCR